MKVTVHSHDSVLTHKTRALLHRMLSPLCGFDTRIGYTMRGAREPRFMCAGAELTGVHILNGQRKPKVGFYHIGGAGVFLEESTIRSLGETVERYSQFISEVSNRHSVVLASYDEIATRGEPVIAPDSFRLYSKEQYSRPGFPWQPFSRDCVLGWLKAPSLVRDAEIWVPAQLLLTGYAIRQDAGERWLFPAVTTGSAAHTRPELAFKNALMELIQVDSAVGHWYSAATAPEILMDERTEAIERLIKRQFYDHAPKPKFYWLANPDLPGMTVACVIRDGTGNFPAVGIGLGASLRLAEAMYKALLEAVAIIQLAKVDFLEHTIGEEARSNREINPHDIFDLDQNVIYYALPEHSIAIETKFVHQNCVHASELPADSTLDAGEEIRLLVNGFRDTNKELVFMDLSTTDIRQLGFTAIRVWSPNTLSLSLPSAPPASHPRFEAYGGFHNEKPHPYP